MKKIIHHLIACVVIIQFSCNDQHIDASKVDAGQKAESYISSPAPVSSASITSIASLANSERRAYLEYYAPVIFKQADEGDVEHYGYDWITNFDFDNDGYYANNKQNWEDMEAYTQNGQHTDWAIRPTIYSSIIEFTDYSLNTKSVVLLYHVYHAKQRYSIHDWERIEIRIDNVNGAPGGDEEINYVVITRHSLHNAREYPDEDLNFMETANGKHVMIWQAHWNLGLIGFAELRFVEESWSTIDNMKTNNLNAKVDINGSGDHRFHYIFVNGADVNAVSYWNAQSIAQYNANSLAAKSSSGNTVPMNNVKKIQYELQDLADIIPDHLSDLSWDEAKTIALADPVIDEAGNTVIPPGIQTFYYLAKDVEDEDEDRKGYIRKHWFWGVYIYGEEGDNFYDELDPEPWQQHYYFAHNGTRGDGSVEDELANRGVFLGKDEYANWVDDHGFDGRWVQLFPD